MCGDVKYRLGERSRSDARIVFPLYGLLFVHQEVVQVARDVDSTAPLHKSYFVWVQVMGKSLPVITGVRFGFPRAPFPPISMLLNFAALGPMANRIFGHGHWQTLVLENVHS